ncbi:MAG: nucleotidyltransferase family protein [Alistipes sp.]|nr:nucleotidyltransferase family protein [Alistipes sp.]
MRNVFFSLVKAAINDQKVTLNSVPNWQKIYTISAQQGVLALVFDAVATLPVEQQPPKALKMQWIASIAKIESRYNHQKSVAMNLAEQFHKNDITTYVLKGFALAECYPKPEHRECGDLDCFLGADYEKGNCIAEALGAKVTREYYKHSIIIYRKLMVENHQFCIGIRGSRTLKEFERHLETIISQGATKIEDSHLIKPSANFNALFIITHALTHFLVEGIKLRHILDWALLLRSEQDNINWKEFYLWADRMHLTIFADAITAISIEHFGLQITNPAIHTSSPYAERILRDTIENSEGLFNKGYSSWKARFMQIRNKLSYAWKYHKIYQKSLLVELSKSVFAFLFEKHPKL